MAMEEKPDSIDDFLESLGLRVEKEPEKVNATQQGHDAKLIISFLEGEYYINCLISGQGLEKEVQGTAIRQHFIVTKTTLADVCGRVEKGLDKYEIAYHRSIPVPPGPSHMHVYYELMPRLSDPNNTLLAADLVKMINQIISDYNTRRH